MGTHEHTDDFGGFAGLAFSGTQLLTGNNSQDVLNYFGLWGLGTIMKLDIIASFEVVALVDYYPKDVTINPANLDENLKTEKLILSPVENSPCDVLKFLGLPNAKSVRRVKITIRPNEVCQIKMEYEPYISDIARVMKPGYAIQRATTEGK